MKRNFNLEQYYNEPVQITIMDDQSGDDLVVTLNGYNYVMKKGQTIEVPRKVAIVIQNSLIQTQNAKAYVDSLISK